MSTFNETLLDLLRNDPECRAALDEVIREVLADGKETAA
jgi:hypothetical protein